ncbi:MAG TPA: peptide-methionine (R)-S-oxide reductase MsrB [Chloroflexota bacterium]|nr:peptide-methionine (R)-S-oxide reductase MsrB [Chloroflexota bacterium]
MQKVEKTDKEWREQLAPEQYAVLRQAATERPFTGKYTYSTETGMYHCAGCNAPLFRSDAKFESHCGWPSFTNPADNENVELRPDTSFGMLRTEVLCRACGGHLGHVFDDGPGPTGLRYCINSAALDLKKE